MNMSLNTSMNTSMNTRDLLLAILVMAIWGFNFSMIKMAVSGVDPLLMTAARFTFAVVPLIFFIPRPDVAWRYLIGYGVVFGVGVWGMASWSIQAGLSSGMSSVLMQISALFSVIAGVWLYKEKLHPIKLMGVAITLTGWLVSVTHTGGNITLSGLFLISVSAVCWTLTGIIVKASGVKNALTFNLWGMLFAPVPLVIFSLLLNGSEGLIASIHAWDSHNTVAVLFQAYPTTLFGYWIWNKMILRYPFSTVAPLTLLVPVFALISGFLMYGETLTQTQLISCGLFLTGVLLIVCPPRIWQKRWQPG